MSDQDVTLDNFTKKTEEDDEDNTSKELLGLGKIPSEWQIKPLSDLAEIIPGNSPPSSTYNEDGDGLPFFQGNTEFGHFHPKADTWCSDPRKEAKANDVLISIRAPVGDLNIADKHCCIGRGLAALRPTELNGLYLFYHLGGRQGWLSRLATGSTFKAIIKSDLQLLDIPTPPLKEQRKIASVLYTVDEAIQKSEEIIEQSEKVKKGLVQNLLTEGAHEYSVYDSYRLGPIDVIKPEAWELKSFDDFSFRVKDGPHITPEYVDEGIPFVSSQNVNPFRENFDYSQYEKYISEETYDEINQNCRPEKGDLIVSRRATIGPTQLIRHDEKFGFFVGVAIIKTDNTIHNPFLEQLMNWSVMEKLWHLKSPGSTMKTLNLGTIKEQKIPVPPIREQKAIAEILRIQDNIIANNERYKQSLQRFKQGLMQDLLSGDIRTTDADIDILDAVAQHG